MSKGLGAARAMLAAAALLALPGCRNPPVPVTTHQVTQQARKLGYSVRATYPIYSQVLPGSGHSAHPGTSLICTRRFRKARRLITGRRC